MVAASNYTVGIEFDTTPAQRAVEDMRRVVERQNRTVDDFQRRLRETESAAKSSIAPLDRVGRSADDMGKRFGVAGGKLKDFGRFGATVFTGDIISKVLGFGSAIAAISAASDLAATGIRAVGRSIFDDLAPGFREAQARATELQEKLDQLRKSLRGEGVGFGLTNGRQTFLRGDGLNDENLERLYAAVQAAQKRITEAEYNNAVRASSRSSQFGAGLLREEIDVAALYEKEANALRALQSSLRVAQREEEKRLQVVQKQNEAYERQLELSKYLGNGQPVTGSGGFGNALGIGGLASRGASGLYGLAFDQRNQAAAQAFAAANQSAQFEEYRRRNFGSQSYVPSALAGGGGFGTLGNAGGGLIGALGGLGASVQRAYTAQAALEAFNREQLRIKDTANEMGMAFGNAFEGFILGAQSAQEAVRQLGLQIIQSLLNHAVTQPLTAWFSQFAFGKLGGVGSIGDAGTATGVPSGISSPLPGGGNFRGGGSVQSGMNYSARQRMDRVRSTYS